MNGRIVLAVLFVLAFAFLYANTGFLQAQAIDDRDLQTWQFENGVIVGAEGFTLEGTSENCWVLIHGYTSTPDELRVVAEAINSKFNDTVYVPRLDGHGMVPSALLNYNIDHWYKQVESVAEMNGCQYLLGSSMGSLFALRYAETHKIKGLVAVGAPFVIQPHYLPTGEFTGGVSSLVTYTKRKSLGESIDDESARKEHISGFSFPLAAVGQVYDFSSLVSRDLSIIDAKVLFLHGINDQVAYINGAEEAFENIDSEKKFVRLDGNHVVFRDFDKERAVSEVISFRNQTGR